MSKEKQHIIDIGRLVRSTGYAIQGVIRAWSNEQAFRHEVMLLPVIIVGLLFFSCPALWWGLLLGSWLLVMAFELLNSAIEEIFNYVSPQFSEAAKNGKDLAAGGVFVAIMIHIVLWLSFFLN